MAIDGRTLVKRTGKSDAYESTWVGIVSGALIWVPLALIVVVAYVTGSWLGGVPAGLLSVGSTVLTALAIWVYRRFFRRHRRG
jgi:membrane protein implicated in regulation of membrane protease activity